MLEQMHRVRAILLGFLLFGLVSPGWAAQYEAAKMFIEYTATDNDLGFHVFLDAEDWTTARIINPDGVAIFDVAGKAAYQDLGLSELFFEGAEPTLDDFPLDELLALFPEGKYTFMGTTVDGGGLMSKATLTHAIPAGPAVSTDVSDDGVVIRWEPVTAPPPGFPNRRVQIVGYQVIVDPFQVTLPAWSTQVTLPPEFVESLAKGEHDFEVLAIEVGGNQTITESSFEIQ